jgi:hypothetical protein
MELNKGDKLSLCFIRLTMELMETPTTSDRTTAEGLTIAFKDTTPARVRTRRRFGGMRVAIWAFLIHQGRRINISTLLTSSRSNIGTGPIDVAGLRLNLWTRTRVGSRVVLQGADNVRRSTV